MSEDFRFVSGIQFLALWFIILYFGMKVDKIYRHLGLDKKKDGEE